MGKTRTRGHKETTKTSFLAGAGSHHISVHTSRPLQTNTQTKKFPKGGVSAVSRNTLRANSALYFMRSVIEEWLQVRKGQNPWSRLLQRGPPEPSAALATGTVYRAYLTQPWGRQPQFLFCWGGMSSTVGSNEGSTECEGRTRERACFVKLGRREEAISKTYSYAVNFSSCIF